MFYLTNTVAYGILGNPKIGLAVAPNQRNCLQIFDASCHSILLREQDPYLTHPCVFTEIAWQIQVCASNCTDSAELKKAKSQNTQDFYEANTHCASEAGAVCTFRLRFLYLLPRSRVRSPTATNETHPYPR